MRPVLISLSILTLAACQGQPPAQDQPPAQSQLPSQTLPPAQDRPPVVEQGCGADRLQDYVGQPLAALDRSTLPQSTRIIGPGMAVTMDYSASRLNIEHDRNQIILRIACG